MRATEAIDFERELPELVRELRALPSEAPEQLRERVRALGEPDRSPELRDRLVAFPWRRALLIAAPACIVALVGAAVVHGLVTSDSPRQTALNGAGHKLGQVTPRAMPETDSAQKVFGAASVPGPFDTPAPNPNRYQDYQAALTVRVRDLDTLSDRTTEAMKAIRSLGGYVASVEQTTTSGRPGRADLVLRVPVSRVQDALARLAGLGTVTEQHLSIRDLNQLVRTQRQQILALRLQIARLTQALGGDLAADVRLRLQFQLDQARRSLANATGRNKATLREAALSRISLTLTTQKAVAATKQSHEGRAERAVRDAGSFLASAGGVVLYLLIVLSPLLALAGLWIWGRRAFRRREEQRLLA